MKKFFKILQKIKSFLKTKIFFYFWLKKIKFIIQKKINISHRKSYKYASYQLISYSEYIKKNKNYYNLVAKQKCNLKAPNVLPNQFKKNFLLKKCSLRIPSIFAFRVSNVKVIGSSDLLYLKDSCLHHDMYSFEKEVIYEDLHGMVSIDEKNKKISRLQVEKKGGFIPTGIYLAGSLTSNYVHWLTEALPKILLINKTKIIKRIPLIIRKNLHKNILQSLSLLKEKKRKVIQIEDNKTYLVKKLIVISPVSYVPFEFKKNLSPNEICINPSFAWFSPKCLKTLRKIILSRLCKKPALAPQKIFFRRTSTFRPMVNLSKVTTLLENHGFVTIDAEKLSFFDQVRLSSNAKIIVGQAGAALGNILFAPASCHVIVLSTWSPFAIHYYFSNLAAILGQRCTLIMSKPPANEVASHPAHLGINVSIPCLKKVISQ